MDTGTIIASIIAGVGVGYLGLAGGLRMVYTHLRTAMDARITALEKALGESQTFERQTMKRLVEAAHKREQTYAVILRRFATHHPELLAGDDASDDDSGGIPPILDPVRRRTPSGVHDPVRP